ncbi:MBL fold metallo-hydrolase [Sulfurimonas aquatica]|uniref:MBL fold metallo-hydrolase n=1 Tax=Sulfurimonas aquatica TaxID=2672570 RepID=A0A975GCY4_9BACT|nr:MBL fold metallo-hydrolase [Sulfurimonas aquatica]QSZ42007.1 MBL fold metallo-hydrolase [Sulfurimonas aquatica]
MAEKEKILYDDGKHKCVMFSFDDESHEDSFLSVNQYLIVQNGSGVLVDPGSEVIFEELYDAVSKHVEIENIKFIFFSHQDPDVSGSISQWAISTKAKFVMSALWVRFMSHYGFMEMDRVLSLADHGAKINFGDDYLKFIPAHFLHSPGNFSLYDSRSKIVFSGDIGAAILDAPETYKCVDEFEKHLEYLLPFHKRYMGSNKLTRAWVKSIQTNDVKMIAPQHGFIFEDENVGKFLEWFEELQCGSDFIDELY